MDSPTLWANALCDWYGHHRRPFPWREDPSPYRVWLSEIMLQQTRIEAALPYYHRFLAALPDIAALAAAPEEQLLKLWEGLGYYSRVRHMQQAAQCIQEQHGGRFPAGFDAIRALPGIGDYTAGAIASICFGIPVPAVDGNVLRVLARLHNDPADVMLPATKKAAAKRLAALLPTLPAPGDFNQGLMELGETVCLPGGVPLCDRCPLQPYCAAYAAGTVMQLPIRTVKTKRRTEQRTLLLCFSDEATPRLLLHKRPAKGLLAGLWELPAAGCESTPEAAADAVRVLCGTDAVPLDTAQGRHLFSHLTWQMTGCAFRTPLFAPPPDCAWVTRTQLEDAYALPSAFRPFTALIQAYLS